jgi:hypothetical protein
MDGNLDNLLIQLSGKRSVQNGWLFQPSLSPTLTQWYFTLGIIGLQKISLSKSIFQKNHVKNFDLCLV